MDRALATLIATAAACAAAVMAVFALGFALYAWAEPSVGPAGAAAVVALVAAISVGAFAASVIYRAREREREQAILKARLAEEAAANPAGFSDIARDRPIVTIAVTALGGFLAARHPTIARELIALVAGFGRR